MAGLSDARAYLDGTAEKRRYRVSKRPKAARTKKAARIKRARD
jgi:hypothetical protein